MAWIGGVLNLVGGRRDNYFNKEEADKARDWSKEMSNTEVQRRVADMKLAGINPMLAAQSGASTPSSAQSAPSSSGRDLGNTVMGSYFSAKQMQMAKQKNDADIAQIEANTAKTVAETQVLQAEVPYSAGNAYKRNEILYSQMQEWNEKVSQARTETEVKQMMPEAQRLINRAMQLGMPEKEATAKFFREIGEGSKWAELVKSLLIGIRSVR